MTPFEREAFLEAFEPAFEPSHDISVYDVLFLAFLALCLGFVLGALLL